jgi:transcriptional regulator
MYEPAHFKVEDRDILLDVIRRNPLGLLISSGHGGLEANPIPFVVAGEPGREVLRAHLARPNGQWIEIAACAEILVHFQSVDHYVSPSWYETKQLTHKVVPTWNYVVVQVRGPAMVDESATWLADQIGQLTRLQEWHRAEPWDVADAPPEFISAQMRGIVGIEIEIREITGKFKLSQNRSIADQQGVIAGLAEEKASDAQQMRAMIEAHLARQGR